MSWRRFFRRKRADQELLGRSKATWPKKAPRTACADCRKRRRGGKRESSWGIRSGYARPSGSRTAWPWLTALGAT